MVNDNVRYAGVSISVDMILSDIAQSVGFEVETDLGRTRSKREIAVSKWGRMAAYHFGNVCMSGEEDNVISSPFVYWC